MRRLSPKESLWGPPVFHFNEQGRLAENKGGLKPKTCLLIRPENHLLCQLLQASLRITGDSSSPSPPPEPCGSGSNVDQPYASRYPRYDSGCHALSARLQQALPLWPLGLPFARLHSDPIPTFLCPALHHKELHFPGPFALWIPDKFNQWETRGKDEGRIRNPCPSACFRWSPWVLPRAQLQQGSPSHRSPPCQMTPAPRLQSLPPPDDLLAISAMKSPPVDHVWVPSMSPNLTSKYF